MSKYTFTFKKDDVFVEFYTADKDVVERQFQIWVSNADDYVNNRPYGNYESIPVTNSAPVNEIKNNTEVIVESAAENIQPQEPVLETESAVEAVEQKDEIIEETVVEEAIEEPEVFDKASTLLKTINTIQEEKENPIKEEMEQPAANFETVLEKSIENPTFEPERQRDQVFLNLVTSKRTTNKFNYLMITVYYLSEFEKLERFSLKQINAKLMQNLSEVIDHAMLQDAINQNLIELIPDLTGTSEVAEYRLTREGEEFFARI